MRVRTTATQLPVPYQKLERVASDNTQRMPITGLCAGGFYFIRFEIGPQTRGRGRGL